VRCFTSIYVHTAHFRQHTEITLQDIPNREYTLRLFVENVAREVQRNDNHTWTPARRLWVPYCPNTYAHKWVCMYRDLSPTFQFCAVVRMKRGHSFWATHREASEVVDLDGIFNDYWISNNHEFIVLSQSLSPTSPRISDRESQRLLSLESIVAL